MLSKLVFTLLLIIVWAPSFASSMIEAFTNDMHRKYGELNTRYAYCKALRKQYDYRASIDDKWFNALSREKKRAAILFAFSYETEKCAQVERANYTESMLNYVANTGDEQPYREWIKLSAKMENEVSQLEALGIEQLQAFSDSQFNHPFDAMKMLKALSLYGNLNKVK